MQIKYIRLVSGENILSQYGGMVNDRHVLKTPVVAIGTNEGLGFRPLSLLGKSNDLTIKDSHVLFIDDPEDEIKNVYNANFGSGIVTVSTLGEEMSDFTSKHLIT